MKVSQGLPSWYLSSSETSLDGFVYRKHFGGRAASDGDHGGAGGKVYESALADTRALEAVGSGREHTWILFGLTLVNGVGNNPVGGGIPAYEVQGDTGFHNLAKLINCWFVRGCDGVISRDY
jgi:hypothetical protein